MITLSVTFSILGDWKRQLWPETSLAASASMAGFTATTNPKTVSKNVYKTVSKNLRACWEVLVQLHDAIRFVE